MDQSPNRAEELKERHPAFFDLADAATRACIHKTTIGHGAEYRFADGSMLRMMTQYVQVIEALPERPEGYRPGPNEIGRFNPADGGMLPTRQGRWMPAVDVLPLLDELATSRAELARVQHLVTTLERIVGSDPKNNQFATLVRSEARTAIETYTGEPYPMLGEADRG
jgi:hypothetical protein